MTKNSKDKKEDISAAVDRGESVSSMEPLLVREDSRHRGELTDLAVDLVGKSAGFKRSLPQSLLGSLADLVRAMNCYYSNLIEGHDTHPVDIERALKNDYSADPQKRDLQLEAKAHIAVQQWIDEGHLRFYYCYHFDEMDTKICVTISAEWIQKSWYHLAKMVTKTHEAVFEH